ncbi:MAG: glutamate racemase [Clostridiales bacterium]|nr:glutamate racemase [Clostridiales bacterium]
MDKRPIGIFDSGLGGLTAVHELMTLMPGEHIIYLGDSANMPYGEKTHEQIVEMSRRDMKFLLSRGVKVIFVACGTATSNALYVLRDESPVPVFGVVEAAVNEALEATRNGRVGLLATRASVAAGTFENMLKRRDPKLLVHAKACPKFATMVEDGIFEKDDERVVAAAEEYLPCLRDAGVDTVILGCTHYPLLADVISEYMGEGVVLISSGAAAARELANYLRENGMQNDNGNGRTEFFTTGDTAAFADKASLMIRRDISSELTLIEPFDKA